jgi:hypothetical protein
VSSGHISGARRVWRYRPSGTASASIPTTACSPRSETSTSTWSHGHRCPPPLAGARHSTWVRERGCSPPYWSAGASPADRLGLADRVEVTGPALYPDGRADLVVCNPPWLPARPTSSVEQGVYDPDGTMLHGFLHGLADHLRPGGEGWLVLSDLAEHLGLRTRAELLTAIGSAGLRVTGRLDTSPRHPRTRDTTDPLHRARAAEVTSLWRLTPD